jgi:osmotically-inducible protein OsmY
MFAAAPSRAGDAGTQLEPPVRDSDLQFRVKSALSSDPYLYTRHIDVSVKNGQVVLSGFVGSDWELDKARRVAQEAARPAKVVDNIEIKEGGRR